MDTNTAVRDYTEVTLPVIDRKDQLKKDRGYWLWRRAQDIFFSVLALLILWPIMLIVALIVYIDDPHGSPIFAQTRCGRDGMKPTLAFGEE